MGEIMKKLALGMTLLASVTLLSACGSSSSSSSNSPKTETIAKKKDSNIKTIQSKSITGNTVGVMKITTTKITQEKVTKSENSKSDAEYNFDGYKTLPKHYYRTTVHYTLKNVGNKKLGLGYSDMSFVDGDGQKYTDSSDTTFGFNDCSYEDLQPNNSESDKFILITTKPINNLKTYSINTGQQNENDDTMLSEGGVIKFSN